MDSIYKDNAFPSAEDYDTNAKIKVIGVGGGGSNAVNQMVLMDNNDAVEYWVFNTDCQALAHSPCPNKFVLGRNVTRGLGAGGNPKRGEEAANDSYNDIQLHVKGADLVFIAAGEGGGTGSGAAPVVAKASKEAGALVLAIVTRPFNFEGKTRLMNALEGIEKLKPFVDSLIIVSNDNLVFNSGSMSITDAFSSSDQILASSVKTVTDLILKHGHINLDYADIRSTLAGSGLALIGIGEGEGEKKAIMASENAINSPLLESSIKGAKKLIVNFTVGNDTTLDEIQYAISYITEACASKEGDINIMFGVQVERPEYDGKVKVAIIGTAFEKLADDGVSHTPALPNRQMAKNDGVDVIRNPELSRAAKEMDGDKKENSRPSYLSSLSSFLRGPEVAKTPEPKKETPLAQETDIETEPVMENKNDMTLTDTRVEISVPDVVKDEEDEDDTIVVDSENF